ncbi:MAG: sn-glycerol-1-phosphate dehydrogenase [Chloroflexota bacterium]|nr:sn-glycerol-1-phosphate dehydrogenase [Chloroflexota bacterium]
MPVNPLVTIGDDALDRLLEFCKAQDRRRLVLVADRNTYRVLGESVDQGLRHAGFDVITVVLGGEEVVADAHAVMQVLLAYDATERTFIAVGSGTITDITRFVSHRTRNAFISMPTAPSVDGFASVGAPLIVGGVKNTYKTHAPIAIFADLPTLANAPRAMIAAGFGDMIGKYTSLADWQIGRLLWDEPYDVAIADGTRRALQICIDNADTIAAASPEGIRSLMEGLIESGIQMLAFGSSHAASGTEHHYSHFWEMKLLWEKRPALLHGAKVGVAATEVAKLYAAIRNISRDDLAQILDRAGMPKREEGIERIRAAFGPDMADEIVAIQKRFLNMDEADFEQLTRRIWEHWDEIQTIARQVPEAQQIAGWLRAAGGPTTVDELGLSKEELVLAATNGHYLRDRFTSRKLLHYLGLDAVATGGGAQSIRA